MNTKSSSEVFPSCPAATTLENIPEDVGAELRGIYLEAFLESLAEERSSLPAQFLKFLLFGDTMGAVKTLSFLKWEGVDFDKDYIKQATNPVISRFIACLSFNLSLVCRLNLLNDT